MEQKNGPFSPCAPQNRAEFLRTLPMIPARKSDAHKGSFGTALLIGGSRSMSGAIRLAGRAAVRSGAGLVRLLVPEEIGEMVASDAPESMTVTAPQDRAGRLSDRAAGKIFEQIDSAQAVGFGPGLGRSLGLELLALRFFIESPCPTVFDADALNALAAREFFLPKERRALFPPLGALPKATRILTPHPGEFARLRSLPTPADPDGRKEAAVKFVRTARHVFGPDAPPILLVLKGAGTIVTDGERVFVNQTGNPGMATGGSGDVLTGIITALLAQKLDPYDAALLAVALHGLAGDAAAETLGQEALCASALIDHLPQAFQTLAKQQQKA